MSKFKFLLILTFLATFTDAVELPSVRAEAHHSLGGSKKADDRWWAQVGDRVYYAPPTSFLGLSQNVSDYYYVMGSKAALPQEWSHHVVGSQGRWHVLHLPGPSMLQFSQQLSHGSGDRRASLSHVSQLRSGTVLATGFPAYELSADYVHPLDAAGQAHEKAAVATVTPEATMSFLQKLVSFPTRSYSNATASDKVEHFLKNEFEAVGLHTCLHNFNDGGNELTNVVAHLPGTGEGSVTVGAHYDSRPFEGAAPGAEDNGSGVAALFTMAKAYMMSKVVPTKSVFFVAFAGEEPGLIGSKHFAAQLANQALPAECTPSVGSALVEQHARKRRARSTEASKNSKNDMHSAIIMDEIGWASKSLSGHTVNLESFDELGKEVMGHLRHSTDMHNADSLLCVHSNHPFGSDHMSFLDLNMKAVLTINGDDEAYPDYHKKTDVIGNVNGELMAKITKMNLGALYRMSLA